MSTDEINDVLNDSSLTVVQKYQRIYGEVVSRDTARHRLDKLRRQVSATNIMNVPKFRKVSVNEDGSQLSERLIECSEACLKDPEYLLKIHGYDIDKFTLVSAQSSLWPGGVNGKTLYSTKIKVKPKDRSKDIDTIVRDTFKQLFENQFDDVTVKVVDDSVEDLMLEVCVPDLHIGLTEDFDDVKRSDIQERFAKCTEEIKYFIFDNNIAKVRIVFLGDIFHYDNANKTTTKGTLQDSNYSFTESYNMAVDLLYSFINTIRICAEDVEVLYVPGNHDVVIGYTLMKVMQAFFTANNGIAFSIHQNERPFKLFGCNLIGYTHGDMDKRRLTQWIYSEARDYISDAKNIEIHVGHLHNESTIEDNGVILRYLPTIAGQSPWEYKQGYNSKRKMAMFLWDKNDGLKSINYINI